MISEYLKALQNLPVNPLEILRAVPLPVAGGWPHLPQRLWQVIALRD